MLPSLQLLEKVSQEVKSIPNRKKESKRRVHYGLFLLGYKSGLRISEAIKFDLEKKNKQGLYRVSKSKGKKERLVYVPKEVIKELRKNHWQPNQTNRWNFYHFLKKIKRELNISKSIELSPHTLRHSFATYHAENGLSLPILSKMLGHSSIRTTALYWRNIYQESNSDVGSILAGKDWLEKKKPPNSPTMENFPKQPPLKLEPIIRDSPPILTKKPIQHNIPPLFTEIKENPITNYQLKSVIGEIPTPTINQKTEISEPLPMIAKRLEPKENILLTKIRNLEEQLKQTQAENNNLKAVVQSEKQINQSLKETIANLTYQNHTDEQNHTNLINAYQKALNDKARAEKQVNYYQEQLKTLAKSLYQWNKINYYQQLEQEQKKQEAKVEQAPKTPPWKLNK